MMLLVSIGVGGLIAIIIGCLFVGVVAGAFITSWHFKKQMNDNPPISESQIRELYRQTGKKLSEAQVMRIMKSIKQKN